MPVIDDRTPLLDLPLPNKDNTLEDDAQRLRDGLGAIDTLLFGKQDALGFTAENTAAKGAVGGYASLDGTGKVPAIQLPSFVDDVVEVANFASLPTTGETGKIYVALDTNKTWRWGGSAYAEISPSPGSTDAVPEGASNKYFTPERVVSALPIASAGVLGAVKIGAGLSIDGAGVLVATSGGGSSMSLAELTPASDGLSTVPVPGGYVVGATLFGLNGALLPPAEYTATDSLNVVFLNTTVGTADRVLVVTLSTVTIGNLPDGSVTAVKLDSSVPKIATPNAFTAVNTPFYKNINTITATGTFVYDPTTHGQVALITLTNAATITFGAPTSITEGAMYKMILKAGDTAVRTFAWNAAYKFPSASSPLGSGSTTVGALDIITFIGGPGNTLIYDGSLTDVR